VFCRETGWLMDPFPLAFSPKFVKLNDEQRKKKNLSKKYQIVHEPYYASPAGDEIEGFSAAYKARLPVLLKGPTGCGQDHVFGRIYDLRFGEEDRLTLL